MRSADLRAGTVYVGSYGGTVPFVLLSTDTFRLFSSRGQNPGSIHRVTQSSVQSRDILSGVLTAQIIISREDRFESLEDEADAIASVGASFDTTGNEWFESDGGPASRVQQFTLADGRVISFRIGVKAAREIGMTFSEYSAIHDRETAARSARQTAEEEAKVQAASDLAEAKTLLRVNESEVRVFRTEPGGRVSITAKDLLALVRRITE